MRHAALFPRRHPLRSVVLAAALLALLAGFIAVNIRPASAADTLISQNRAASASSAENGNLSASAALDGNTGTRWSSTFSQPQWLRVDLGGNANISRVVLRWEAAYASAFTIQTSPNGNTWTNIYSTTNGTGGNQDLTVTGSGRYVRINATNRATTYGVSLWEFQVFGTYTNGAPPPPPPPPPPPAPPPPPPGNIVRVSEFLADCPFSHRLPDDPIVFPNMAGASHMHSFFGAAGVNAGSTDVSDLMFSNCNPSIDLSSYWVPTLYANNNAVEPVTGIFYYLGEGIRPDLVAQTQPLPLGLKIVAGNAKATGPDNGSNARWSCLHHNEVGASKDFVTCPNGSMLESYLDFPQCWNGTTLDSADHKSHMSYPVNGACPSSHPVAVPKLRQVLRYPVSGNKSQFRLASGGGFTMHGDFFNAWPVNEMRRRVENCIRPVIKCGTNGYP